MTFNVLLIDDEPGALEGLALWIDWERLGFNICGTCSNGLEGLQKMVEYKPDLVITDVNMPLMDGLLMIETWQQEYPDSGVKFVVMSGYSEFEYARKALRHGINHYILKPVIGEEAEEELSRIHEELVQEKNRFNLGVIAMREEAISLIKHSLLELPLKDSGLVKLQAISSAREAWSCCLIQSEPSLMASVRETIASLSVQMEGEYVIDLEPNRIGLVYGHSASGESESSDTLRELLHRHAGQRLIASEGATEPSLLNIHRCYLTAKEAIEHKFYDTDYGGSISYREIRDQPFHYHYQISLMDDVIRSVELLDKAGFREAATIAASAFRELWIAPGIVKKMVIHVLYRIIGLVKEAEGAEPQNLSSKYNVAGLTDGVTHLDDLIGDLIRCGEECIEHLLVQQARQSQGVIQEINHYIHLHYRENLTIKRLAELFYLHPVYLGQLLIRKNGIGFSELIHNLRIDEATALLKQNKLKNSEIADRVGYSHYNQFLKHFEKRWGMSPNEFKSGMF
ncbi:AraC family transcriptional regulator [Paenibacillus glucanolyticus]|uniref:AraC family transcriptional regulator n=1 Tax=Paenibacillus glucanolyticus TaxID=59843 RepID=A0A163K2X7_9BACL|nr:MULTISPECIES: response regulator [Paenibacillus]AWP29571.1 DNA-binding response regulator [Paenibacillus sp. Cedars]KZS46960.1 AraC family transcriptional regulator [Paenibacillus glucanolyticus]